MKTRILPYAIFFLTFCEISAVFAQVQLGKPTWEIGTDLLWLVDKSNTPVSFILKNHRNKLKKDEFKTRHYAYRLRIGIDLEAPIDFTAQLNYPNYQVFNAESYHIYFRPGYEIKKKMNPFEVYYGIDIPVSYLDFLSESLTTDQGVPQNGERRERRFTIGVAPVCGVSVTLLDRIKLSLESSIDIAYSKTKSSYEIIAPDPRLLSESFKGTLQVDFFPIHTLIFSIILN